MLSDRPYIQTTQQLACQKISKMMSDKVVYKEKFGFTPCSARSKKSNQKKGRSTRSKEKKRRGRQLEAEEWRLPGLHNIFAQGNRSYIEAMVILVVKFEGRDTKLYKFG